MKIEYWKYRGLKYIPCIMFSQLKKGDIDNESYNKRCNTY